MFKDYIFEIAILIMLVIVLAGFTWMHQDVHGFELYDKGKLVSLSKNQRKMGDLILDVCDIQKENEFLPSEFDCPTMVKLCFYESSLIRTKNSSAHAHGLCQIKYDTAKDRLFNGTIRDLYKYPEENARIAMLQIKWCYNKFGGIAETLDCYNAGYGWCRYERPWVCGYSSFVNRILVELRIKL